MYLETARGFSGCPKRKCKFTHNLFINNQSNPSPDGLMIPDLPVGVQLVIRGRGRAFEGVAESVCEPHVETIGGHFLEM